jgi:DNA repair exonuclease SbcCD ATPase subunit
MDIETEQKTVAKLEGDKVSITLTRVDHMTKKQAEETIEQLKKQKESLAADISQIEKELEAVKEGWLPRLRKLQEDLEKINKLQNTDNLKFALKDKKERMERVNEALSAFSSVITKPE